MASYLIHNAMKVDHVELRSRSFVPHISVAPLSRKRFEASANYIMMTTTTDVQFGLVSYS